MGLIRRAIMNLLSNAVRYSNESGCIFITTSVQDSWACLSVRDQGVGMTEEQLASIQANTKAVSAARIVHSDAAGSLGGGLSVVQTVRRRHNGVLEVQSQLDQGSVFTLRFPKSSINIQN